MLFHAPSLQCSLPVAKGHRVKFFPGEKFIKRITLQFLFSNFMGSQHVICRPPAQFLQPFATGGGNQVFDFLFPRGLRLEIFIVSLGQTTPKQWQFIRLFTAAKYAVQGIVIGSRDRVVFVVMTPRTSDGECHEAASDNVYAIINDIILTI